MLSSEEKILICEAMMALKEISQEMAKNPENPEEVSAALHEDIRRCDTILFKLQPL